ncbi:probable NAD(P)H dehydrogenase subunit CRR3, chloroplastic [Ziziphus jujuba]|uniref:Probable NAD(P)H dehydrogenase subunit CRR3, chloroplastic n=1 Tax=Ziziphus jujuba TaxID=326968 RepID=A0A6P4AI54_ZIZJJ|nr:probable NAD(P)H dehydrogenase subunit CRR3, chloroplastic [Ziziphus jujuba]
MSCLCSCFYTTTTTPRNMAIIIASLPDNAKSNHSPPPVQTHHSLKPTTTILPSKTMEKKKKPQKPRQPSVIEIERATGAGRFRDTDSRELEELKDAKFDMSLMNFPGKFEGPLEKKLRETGEFMANQSERGFRSSSKKILIFAFKWMLPVWTLLVLVASGAIKLPFSSPFLDQLIM